MSLSFGPEEEKKKKGIDTLIDRSPETALECG